MITAETVNRIVRFQAGGLPVCRTDPGASAREVHTRWNWPPSGWGTTPIYRPEAVMDGWAKVFTFLSRHLSG